MSESLIDQILFPFDFSSPSRQAAPFVQALASRFGSRVTLLSVVPPLGDVSSAATGPTQEETVADRMRELKTRLDCALVGELRHVEVTRVVECGDPALTITNVAETCGADLIMMPTHGHGPFHNLVLGSVTTTVLHDAKCPVWTAVHAETPRASECPSTVLCTLDGTPADFVMLRWAAELSGRLGATLKLLHVLRPISDWLSPFTERGLQERCRVRAIDKLEKTQRLAGVTASLTVAVGEVVTTVTEQAREEQADLILIGRGSLQSTSRRRRTYAHAIIQRASCPVLSV